MTVNLKSNTHCRVETVELRRVGSVNTPVGNRDRLQFRVLTSDDIITSLLKSYKNSRILHCTADSNVYKHAASYFYIISYFYSIGYRIVNWVMSDGCVHIAESVSSHRELVANSCTHCRRDATRQFRRVGGVYWALAGAELNFHVLLKQLFLQGGRSVKGVSS